MCCVIPPASPATTFALRMASSSDVFPWSTWPMIVMTGGRSTRSFGSSSISLITSSTSASETRTTLWPNSSMISSAVSASIVSFWVTIIPLFINDLTTSPTRSAIRLASSDTTIAGGRFTLRTTFSRSTVPPMAFWRARSCLRFICAMERCRPPSPPESAWFSVNLPERRLSSLCLLRLSVSSRSRSVLRAAGPGACLFGVGRAAAGSAGAAAAWAATSTSR